jgi:acetolactate synthase-1/2/3 large subunit
MHSSGAQSLLKTQMKPQPFATTRPSRAGSPWIDPAADASAANGAAVDHAAQLIDGAQCPLLCLGSEVGLSGAGLAALDFAERVGLPMAATPRARGVLWPRHPLSIGQLEVPANRFLKMILQETDLLIAVGARRDYLTIRRSAGYCPAAKLIHVDLSPSDEPADAAISGDLGSALGALLCRLALRRRGKWLVRVDGLRQALSPSRRTG